MGQPFSLGGNYTAFPQATTSNGTTKIVMPNERNVRFEEEKPQKNPHEKGNVTFTRIFANSLAEQEIAKEKPVFPVGSVIVREKLLNKDDTAPEVVTVMVKRQKGFSPKTGNWEFFVLDGKIENVQQRETVGSCSKCHTEAKENDWVFRSYLKK